MFILRLFSDRMISQLTIKVLESGPMPSDQPIDSGLDEDEEQRFKAVGSGHGRFSDCRNAADRN